MAGQPRLDEGLDLGGKLVGRGMAGLEHDEGLDDFGAQRIGLADRGGQRHGGVADQAILDFAGADAEAGRRNHVVVAADKVK